MLYQTTRFYLASAFLAVAFLSGCGGGGVEYTPLTESETLMFSDSIKEAIEFYDLSFFLGHQDKNRLRERTEARGEAARTTGNVSGLFLDQFDLADGILVGDPTQGTHWNYVNQNRIFTNHPPDSSSLIQIRVHDVDFNHEYYTFLVESRKGSRGAKAVISDYFIHTSGEWISATAYEMAAMDSAMAALSLEEQDRVNKALEKGAELIDEKKYAEAEELLKSLPESMLVRKGPAALWLEASLSLGERDYDAALQNYRASFPSDPTSYRSDFERSFGLGRYQAAMASIDELEVILGGPDAYQMLIRGIVWKRMEQPDSAFAAFQTAIKMEPEFPQAYVSLMYHSLDEAAYYKATAALIELNKMGYKLEDFDFKAYPEFLNSDAIQDYLVDSDPYLGDEEEVEEKGRAKGSREDADG